MGWIKDDYSSWYVQAIPNKYQCPDCGRKGIFNDPWKRELCVKCIIKRKKNGSFF